MWTVNGDVVRDTGFIGAATDQLDLAQPGHGNASDEIKVEVSAFDGDQSSKAAIVDATVVSTPPVVSGLPATAAVQSGQQLTRSGTVSDADGSAFATTVDYGDGAGAEPLVTDGNGGFTLQHTYVTVGTYAIVVSALDPQGKAGTATVTVTVTSNQGPTIAAGGPATLAEGNTLTRTGTVSDPESDPVTATVDYDGPGGAAPASLAITDGEFSLSHTYADNGTYPVTVTAKDSHDATATPATFDVTVGNVAPVVGTPTGGPVQLGSPVTVTATFTDTGTADTHIATIDWGDTTAVESGAVTESNGAGSVAKAHTYTGAGVYTVRVTVTDDDGDSSYAEGTVTVDRSRPDGAVRRCRSGGRGLGVHDDTGRSPIPRTTRSPRRSTTTTAPGRTR